LLVVLLERASYTEIEMSGNAASRNPCSVKLADCLPKAKIDALNRDYPHERKYCCTTTWKITGIRPQKKEQLIECARGLTPILAAFLEQVVKLPVTAFQKKLVWDGGIVETVDEKGAFSSASM
jgi:hypothetical protein